MQTIGQDREISQGGFSSMKKVQRVLISVSDKTGVVDFAKGLRGLDVEIVSTGGTAKVLKAEGLPIIPISDFTGYPEMLDGRVKTLHPKVHAGLLARRDSADHQKQMQAHGILPIDMVVVNLYPFEQTIGKKGASLEEIIENIDIGGPTLLRSAAKNYRDVAVIVNPRKYDVVLGELKKNNGSLSEQLKMRLAFEAFKTTAAYDTIIHNYFKDLTSSESGQDFPQELHVLVKKVTDLRYGENPHQKAALYRDPSVDEPCACWATILSGKELSFNNLVDADSACELVKEFDKPAAAIIKHNNPCGAAEAPDILDAFLRARETDPVSAFGGVIALNRPVTLDLAKRLNEGFVEVLMAPSYDEDALEELKGKKNMRILVVEKLGTWKRKQRMGTEIKKIVGGLLLQDRDLSSEDAAQAQVLSARRPTAEELPSLTFAWKIAKHVRSNAIVFVSGTETVAIGAGQMSRVDSVKIAIMKARKPLKGTVLASDAFFPFRDGIDEAAKVGVVAVIQPGGSVKDEEVLAAANEHNMVMVLTGVRHFKH
jgi:phosphoribosylaminoimidazolecarboxamide formyltransferase / IMP cyclohydrolase